MTALVQRLGLSGSALMLVAAFLPLWRMRERTTTVDFSLFDAIRFVPLVRDKLGISGADIENAVLGSTVAFVVIALVALAGYLMAMFGARRTLLIPGLAGLLLGGGFLAYSLAEIGRINDEIPGALGTSLHLSWGWAVYFGAVLAVALAGILGFVGRSAPSLAEVGARAEPGSRPPSAREASSAAAWEPASAPRGWMLSGKDAGGRRLRLRLEEAMLAEPEGLVLGRGPTRADVLIDDESISRAHVRVRLGDDALVFEDLDSTNGTRIDGQRLPPHDGVEALAGAEITIGGVRLLLSRR